MALVVRPNTEIVPYEPICFSCTQCEKNGILYKNLCSDCYLINIQCSCKTSNGIPVFELFTFLIENDHLIQDYDAYDSAVKLKRYLTNMFNKMYEYDSRIESKCKKCQQKYDRNLDHGTNLHILKCNDCGDFCSNCGHSVHTLVDKNMSCKEYRELYYLFHGGFITWWLQRFINGQSEPSKYIKTVSTINIKNRINVLSESQLIECTTSENVGEPYFCLLCGEERTCVSITCLEPTCNHKFINICGNCICARKNIKPSRIIITIIGQNGEFFIFERKDDEENFTGKICFEGDESRESTIVWDAEHGQYKICRLNNSYTYGRFIGFDESGITGNENNVSFLWGIDRSSGTNIEESMQSKCIVESFGNTPNYKIQKLYTCIDDGHVVEVNNYDNMYFRLTQYDLWKKQIKSVNKIIKLFRRKRTIHNWYKCIDHVLLKIRSTKTIIRVYKYHVNYTKWIACIYHVITMNRWANKINKPLKRYIRIRNWKLASVHCYTQAQKIKSFISSYKKYYIQNKWNRIVRNIHNVRKMRIRHLEFQLNKLYLHARAFVSKIGVKRHCRYCDKRFLKKTNKNTCCLACKIAGKPMRQRHTCICKTCSMHFKSKNKTIRLCKRCSHAAQKRSGKRKTLR